MPTVTSKGQVTIPKWIRDELGLAPGTEVEFEIVADHVILRKKVSAEELTRWQGYLHESLGLGSVDEYIDGLRGEGMGDK
jgi:AbrB family looped-hinge helix DNA binding protein